MTLSLKTLSLNEQYKFASLQMAAEAFLRTPAGDRLNEPELLAALVTGNKHSSRFAAADAEDFLKHGSVAAQQENTGTGFSGTLFECIASDPVTGAEVGERVVSFRSTEFVDDAVRDNMATNDLEIKNTGWAWGRRYGELTLGRNEGSDVEMRQKRSVDRNHNAGFALNISVALLFSLVAAACSGARAADEERFRKAEELFKLRCASAGEKIKRTVKDVEGIFLLKIRSGDTNFGEQFRMDDPYGRDVGGDGYIQSFLNAKFEARRRFAAGLIAKRPRSPDEPVGYTFVEAIDPADHQQYRYTASLEQRSKTAPKLSTNLYKVILHRTPVSTAKARYGVSYDDISTHEDRAAWIAGSSLKVIDLQTKEVIAERIGYMIDLGQGRSGDGGGRSPWLVAASNACPAFPGPHAMQIGQTDRFVEKVLLPKPAFERQD